MRALTGGDVETPMRRTVKSDGLSAVADGDSFVIETPHMDNRQR